MTKQSQLSSGQSGLPVDNPTESYWHRERSEKLLGHRTTKELPHSADVVIVGSGITGSFAAHFLKEKRPDLSVVMLEAREACWGATGRNGGHCQPAMYTPAPHIASFELRNFYFLKSLVETYSIPCDWHTTSGVHACYSAELFGIVKKVVEKLNDKYPDLAANVAIVTKGEKGSPAWLLKEERKELTLEGLRVGNAEGAIVQWNAASLWPYKLVAFVLERLLAANESEEGKEGFNLQTSTPVTGLTPASTPRELSGPVDSSASSQSSSEWTVHTPRGSISATNVLLATNGYTSHLLPAFSDLLVPTRGQVSSLKPPVSDSTEQPPLDIGHTFYIMGEPNAPFGREDYLVQRPPPSAELVFGGGRQHAAGRGVGVWDDSTIDDPVAWYLRGELGEVVDLSNRPDAAHNPSSDTDSTPTHPRSKKQDLEPTYQWTGVMGYSRDGHPFVGRVPESLGGGGGTLDATEGQESTARNGSGGKRGGLWLCAGYTGHGMPNATLSAKAIVDMMYGLDDGQEEIDLPPEYELTEERISVARLKDELRAADARGSLYADFGDLAF